MPQELFIQSELTNEEDKESTGADILPPIGPPCSMILKRIRRSNLQMLDCDIQLSMKFLHGKYKESYP